MDALRLYLRYASLSVRAQLAYRATFVTKTLGHLLSTGIEFLGLWALFARFGAIESWTLADVALLYGITEIAFAINAAVSRGFDRFHAMLKAGDFDRLLLRPRSTILQLLGQELHLMRVGRLAQGLAVLGWAGAAVDWSIARAALLALAIATTALVFFALVVFQAASAFWTVEGLEVWNAFTYGGNYASQYPMSIYRRWFRLFFTAIVPLACTCYLPARAILGRDPLGAVHALAPLLAALFLAAALGAWRAGVRRHASTGS